LVTRVGSIPLRWHCKVEVEVGVTLAVVIKHTPYLGEVHRVTGWSHRKSVSKPGYLARDEVNRHV
jgi:hypothetical protein